MDQVLAPSNEAFASFLNSSNSTTPGSDALAAQLSYHVLPGLWTKFQLANATQFLPTLLSDPFYANVTGGQRVGVVSVGGEVIFQSALKAWSSLITADILYYGPSTGVTHVIDRVLTPPVDIFTTLQAAKLNGPLSILVNAPPDPALAQVIGPVSDWTLFAANSTDFNWRAAPEDAVFAWEEYHILPGLVAYSPLMTDGKQFQTLQGNNLTITVLPNSSKYVNDVNIVDSDYLISTEVVHLLERSLNPNDTSARPQTSQTSPTTTANSTASQTGAPRTLPSRGSGGLSEGVKAGIGVGAVVGGIAIVGLVLWYLWRRKHATIIPREVSGDIAREWKSELEQPQPTIVQEMEAPYAELHGRDRHELQ